MTDWYEKAIEEPIRNLVKLLRDNGYNTFCSCGHDMYVEMEYYSTDEEIRRLYDLLVVNGYTDFEIDVHWEYHESLMSQGKHLRVGILVGKNGEKHG